MKEFEAKVRLNEENGGKTGELDIMSPPPFDKGYFNGVTFGITFKEPVFEAERPHGEWIYHKGKSESRECSNCGVWLDWFMPRNSFCPNCGADMRKEGDENGIDS